MNKDNNEIIGGLIEQIIRELKLAGFDKRQSELILKCVNLPFFKALRAKDDKLKEVVEKIRLVEEIYIGMDGFLPQTAPEAYQQQTLKEMYDELKSIKETL